MSVSAMTMATDLGAVSHALSNIAQQAAATPAVGWKKLNFADKLRAQASGASNNVAKYSDPMATQIRVSVVGPLLSIKHNPGKGGSLGPELAWHAANLSRRIDEAIRAAGGKIEPAG